MSGVFDNDATYVLYVLRTPYRYGSAARKSGGLWHVWWMLNNHTYNFTAQRQNSQFVGLSDSFTYVHLHYHCTSRLLLTFVVLLSSCGRCRTCPSYHRHSRHTSDPHYRYGTRAEEVLPYVTYHPLSQARSGHLYEVKVSAGATRQWPALSGEKMTVIDALTDPRATVYGPLSS